MQISQLKETRSEADCNLDFRALDFQITQLTEKVTVLQEQNELFRAKNAKIKQHYKELYDSIKITRAKHIEQITALLTKNENLKAQIHENLKCITMDSVKPRVLAPGRYDIDVEPIPPHNRNNMEVHLDYLKHLKESVETLCEIVEEAKQVWKPKKVKQVWKASGKVLTSVGYQWRPTRRIFTSREWRPLTRLTKPKVVPTKQTENVSTSKTVITEKLSHTSQKSLTRYKCRNQQYQVVPVSLPISPENQAIVDSMQSVIASANQQEPNQNWGSNFPNSLSSNFMKKFIGTVRFGNDHFGAIMGYGDCVIGDSVISRVYYVEGLGHNLFSVGQFCDSDLEVACGKHSCYVRDTDGVELIKDWDASDFLFKEPYIIVSKPRAVIYRDRNDQKKMMRETEVHKFSDETLNRILEKLDHMVKDFKLYEYNPGMATRIWSEDDRRMSKDFMENPEAKRQFSRPAQLIFIWVDCVLPKTRHNCSDQHVRATNIVLQGLPKDIYKLINHNIEAKAIWDNVKMLLAGSELTKEDRESQLYDEFERFKMLPEWTMPNIPLNSNYVNNMSPEWDRFVTAVKLNKGLKETNHEQLYAYLKQHEKHAAQDRLIIERITPATNDQLAFVSTVQPHAQSSHVQSHQYPSSSTNHQSLQYPQFPETSQIDSGYTQTDEILDNLTKQMALLAQSFRATLPQTNNQLRTSSNTRNQATIQDGRVVVQNVQGRQNQRYLARGNGVAGNRGAHNRARECQCMSRKTVKCYKVNGILEILHAQENGSQILMKMNYTFLASEPGQAPLMQMMISTIPRT
ncbi:hypothetical protein Tco_0838592 [Tanacetum coccineum]|uniref:Integrase, catalytic region, zinc finger, CCHC-type, peptidase aspartic, catalytic n=1 Tax=Tanacetum coccineum TaxID=301880 RepID=A0ABQ5AN82_9ASTR